jgi:hypothetical protein
MYNNVTLRRVHVTIVAVEKQLVLNIMTTSGLDGARFESRQGQGSFPLSRKYPDLLWNQTSLLLNEHRRSLQGLKRSGSEVDHLNPSSVEVKNEWSQTSAPHMTSHYV